MPINKENKILTTSCLLASHWFPPSPPSLTIGKKKKKRSLFKNYYSSWLLLTTTLTKIIYFFIFFPGFRYLKHDNQINHNHTFPCPIYFLDRVFCFPWFQTISGRIFYLDPVTSEIQSRQHVISSWTTFTDRFIQYTDSHEKKIWKNTCNGRCRTGEILKNRIFCYVIFLLYLSTSFFHVIFTGHVLNKIKSFFFLHILVNKFIGLFHS